MNKDIVIYKGNSSIPLFKTRKSMDKKLNRGNKPKLRETHQTQEENNDTTLKCNTHRN